jgi:hypothetical protein
MYLEIVPGVGSGGLGVSRDSKALRDSGNSGSTTPESNGILLETGSHSSLESREIIDELVIFTGSESSRFRNPLLIVGTAVKFIEFMMEAGGIVEIGTTPSGMSFTATCG